MNKQNMVSSCNRILLGHKKEWRADTCMKWDAKHLFLCLLPTCASSLEQHLFKAFVQLLISLFNFLLSCKSSLYILDINPLSDVWLQFESVRMRWMKLEPVIQSEVSQKEKHQYSMLLLLLLLSRFSRVWLCATPEVAAHQAPPSLGFSRQEHWSGLPFPSPMHESEKRKWSHSVVPNS